MIKEFISSNELKTAGDVEDALKNLFKDTLQEKVDINKIKLLAMTYAMGDAITKITPMSFIKFEIIEKNVFVIP